MINTFPPTLKFQAKKGQVNHKIRTGEQAKKLHQMGFLHVTQ